MELAGFVIRWASTRRRFLLLLVKCRLLRFHFLDLFLKGWFFYYLLDDPLGSNCNFLVSLTLAFMLLFGSLNLLLDFRCFLLDFGLLFRFWLFSFLLMMFLMLLLFNFSSRFGRWLSFFFLFSLLLGLYFGFGLLLGLYFSFSLLFSLHFGFGFLFSLHFSFGLLLCLHFCLDLLFCCLFSLRLRKRLGFALSSFFLCLFRWFLIWRLRTIGWWCCLFLLLISSFNWLLFIFFLRFIFLLVLFVFVVIRVRTIRITRGLFFIFFLVFLGQTLLFLFVVFFRLFLFLFILFGFLLLLRFLFLFFLFLRKSSRRCFYWLRRCCCVCWRLYSSSSISRSVWRFGLSKRLFTIFLVVFIVIGRAWTIIFLRFCIWLSLLISFLFCLLLCNGLGILLLLLSNHYPLSNCDCFCFF